MPVQSALLRHTALLCALLLLPTATTVSADPISRAVSLSNASLVVEEGGKEVVSANADRPMVPASTMKLVTALAAIERWGLDHRFTTDFYRGRDGRLWVKGGGDPYLVSEELDSAVAGLKRQGLRDVTGIGLDDSLVRGKRQDPGPVV